MKYALPIVFALLIAPAVSLAGDRWDSGNRGGGDRGSRSDRGYRYDRGERYSDRGNSRSRSSFGLSFGFGNSGYRDNSFGSLNYGYNRGGYNRGRYYDDCYRPPVVYRESYVCPPPRYEYSSRYYDSPPARVYVAPAPRVYYYDPGTTGTYYSGRSNYSGGSNYSGSAYYYRR